MSCDADAGDVDVDDVPRQLEFENAGKQAAVAKGEVGVQTESEQDRRGTYCFGCSSNWQQRRRQLGN